MGDYKPPFIITNEILSYVASISEKIGRITATGNMESKQNLIHMTIPEKPNSRNQRYVMN